MFHVILYEPEIPPNTGNIIRLCANTGCKLHLIKPLGFVLDDKRARRAGLDYHEFAQVRQYDSLTDCMQQVPFNRVFACTTKATQSHATPIYQSNDAFLFGPETRGLPMNVLKDAGDEHMIRIPMQPQSRSLNLSNSVAVIVYEAWRQCGFVLS